MQLLYWDIVTVSSLKKNHIYCWYYIGSDNRNATCCGGICRQLFYRRRQWDFSLAFDEDPDSITEIDIYQDTHTFTFAAFDLFVKVAQHIVEGKEISLLGPKRDRLAERIQLKPVAEPDLIKGHVTYVDNYENVFTNIDQELFFTYRAEAIV